MPHDATLYKLLAAIRLETEGVPERLSFLIHAAETYGLHEVPEYQPLINAMAAVAHTPLNEL